MSRLIWIDELKDSIKTMEEKLWTYVSFEKVPHNKSFPLIVGNIWMSYIYFDPGNGSGVRESWK